MVRESKSIVDMIIPCRDTYKKNSTKKKDVNKAEGKRVSELAKEMNIGVLAVYNYLDKMGRDIHTYKVNGILIIPLESCELLKDLYNKKHNRNYLDYDTNRLTPIVGFSKYLISRDGIIFSTKYNKIRRMSYKTDKDGYYYLGLYDENNKRKFRRVSRLVATTFIPNPNNYPIVNHKDGNTTNNHCDNLEWCTESENMLHSFRELGRKPSITTNKEVVFKYKDSNEIIKLSSIKEFSEYFGLPWHCGYRVLSSKHKWDNSGLQNKIEIISVGCND